MNIKLAFAATDFRLSGSRSAAPATQTTAAQPGAPDAQVSDLDAVAVVDTGDEVALAALAVVVLVGEPDVRDGVGLDGLDVVRDGGVAGGEAVEDLLVDFVGARMGLVRCS
jgi:hypothetical protein